MFYCSDIFSAQDCHLALYPHVGLRNNDTQKAEDTSPTKRSVAASAYSHLNGVSPVTDLFLQALNCSSTRYDMRTPGGVVSAQGKS